MTVASSSDSHLLRRIMIVLLLIVTLVLLAALFSLVPLVENEAGFRQFLEPTVCQPGEDFIAVDTICDGDDECTDLYCVALDGTRRDVRVYFSMVLAVLFLLMPLTAFLASRVSRPRQQEIAFVGSPATRRPAGGKPLFIKGAGGLFVVQFQRDSLPLDQKLAGLQEARMQGRLTEEQFHEVTAELNRRDADISVGN